MTYDTRGMADLLPPSAEWTCTAEWACTKWRHVDQHRDRFRLWLLVTNPANTAVWRLDAQCSTCFRACSAAVRDRVELKAEKTQNL